MGKAEFDSFFERKTIKVTEKNNLECSLNLSDDNADRILSLTGKVYRATEERDGDDLIYGGLATFNSVFGGEELMRIEAGAKFSFKTTPPKPELSVRKIEYFLLGIKIKSEGGMLYATASLIAEIYYVSVEEKPFAVNVDALKKMQELTMSTEHAFSGRFDLEESFDVKKIKRVLFSDACAVVKSVQAGMGAATVEGEAIITVLMLPFSENGDILKEVRCVPFRFEADVDGADDTSVVSADATPDDISLKVYVDEDKNKATVNIVLTLAIKGVAVTRTATQYVEDCYSPENELILSRETLNTRAFKAHAHFTERISEKLNCAVPEYARLIKLIGETTELTKAAVKDGFLMAEGVVFGNALMIDGENNLISNAFQLPFSVSAPVEVTPVDNVKAVCEEMHCKMRNGRLEAEANVIISYDEYEDYAVDVITEVTEGDKKQNASYAISVYLGSAGDTEWDVTKRLGVSQDVVLKDNPELSFPLSGGEKILVYRKL